MLDKYSPTSKKADKKWFELEIKEKKETEDKSKEARITRNKPEGHLTHVFFIILHHPTNTKKRDWPPMFLPWPKKSKL